jgi:CHAT domain-containing protein
MAEEHASQDIAELTQRAQGLLASGRSAEAADLFGQLLDRLDAEGSDDVHTRADFARLRGTALREAGDLEASTRSLESSIALLEEASRAPAEDFILAIALRSVALNYDATGEKAKAARARGGVRDIMDRLLGSLPDRVSDLAFALSGDLESAGRADWQEPIDWLAEKTSQLDDEGALHLLRRLHQFWLDRAEGDAARRVVAGGLERIRALDDAALSQSFVVVHNLAWAALQSNLVASAGEIADRMDPIAISRGANDLHAVRRLAAFVAQRSGRDKGALDQFRAAHELALASFGAEDARTRASQRDLADALARIDRSDEAIEVYRAVLDVELRVGEDRLASADLATALAEELDAVSRFSEAEEMFRLAFSIRSEMLSPVHPDTNESRYEVAELSRVLGRAEESEFYFLQALEVEARLGGTETEMGALIRNNLADLYQELGRYDEARPLLDEALAIRCALHGEDSERAWRSRETLAIWERDAGDTARAVELARAGISRSDPHGSFVWHLILAGALIKQGEVEEAEDLYRQLHEAIPRDDIGGAVSWEAYLEVLEGLTVCQVLQENWAGAAETASELPDTIRWELSYLVQDSSEMQLARFVRRVAAIQSLWLWSLARGGIQDRERLQGAFELVQLTKGLRTRYLRWRQPGVANVEHIAPPGQDQALRRIRDQMQRLQNELTAEFLARDDAGAFARSQTALANRARLRELERHLARGITDWEMLLDVGPVLSERLLPAGATALEIVVVRDVLAERDRNTPAAHRYLAFVIGPAKDDPLLLVDLGLCVDLDEAVNNVRDSLMGEPWIDGAREPAWSRLARYLGRKVLAPCWNRIAAARHLLISPDGGLGALPFEILGTPEDGYLLDKLPVSYLIRTGELDPYRQPFRIEGDPLVLAGPDFDLSDAFTARRTGQFGAERILARTLGGANRFEPLPEARREGAAVAELLGVEPLLGAWALAPELLRSYAPEIVHLSTHGFCLPYAQAVDDPLSLAASLGNAIDRRVVLEDPLQRSGLAMSGANAVLDGRSIPPEAGEGLIYASDIQLMDLQRTDLVVLSACRSGLGDVEIGDGAHGLRRAFLAAGCRSVVSALWDVPETSARKLLEGFYQRLLNGAGRLEALAEARASVRAEYPRDPIHWAGFVLDGNFEPLWRFSPLRDFSVASVSFRAWDITGEADPEAIERLAERIVHGRSADPAEAKSPGVVTLRRALAHKDLDDELRIVALARLGDLANRLGDNERAVAYYRDILQMDGLPPDDRVGYSYNVAKILQQMGRAQEAIAGYTELLNNATSALVRSTTRINRGYAYLQDGRIDDAVSDFTAVIDDSEAPADQRFMAYSNRSTALEPNDPRRALTDVEGALALGVADNVETWKLQFVRARLLIRLGQRQPALDQISDLEREPQLSDEFRGWLADLRSEALGL